MTVNVFNFNGHPVHSRMIKGQPWFMVADVNRILYGRTSGMAWMLDKLDADEHLKCDRTTLNLPARGHPITLVSESGLYKLIMRSDKPEAKVFQNWVTKEAMPDTPAFLRVTEKVPVIMHPWRPQPFFGRSDGRSG